jgi:hypothetical protein
MLGQFAAAELVLFLVACRKEPVKLPVRLGDER